MVELAKVQALASWEEIQLKLQFWGVRYKLGSKCFPPKAHTFESITDPQAPQYFEQV